MKTSITASMLYDLVQCPHRVTMDLVEDSSKRDPINPFVQLLWEKGNAFEQEVIEGLQVPFVNLRLFSGQEREQLTIEAMARGDTLIYGGQIRADDLLGDPDLLRRKHDGYVAGDIKSGAGVRSEPIREEVTGTKKGRKRGRAGGDVYVKQKGGLFCKGEVFFLLSCPLMGDQLTISDIQGQRLRPEDLRQIDVEAYSFII